MPAGIEVVLGYPDAVVKEAISVEVPSAVVCKQKL